VTKRKATALGLGAGALAALLAHAAYWYLPRERASTPSPAALARLGERQWTVVAWVPFPHQNLARLEHRVGDLRRWLALVLPAGSAPAERLPSFGPWLVPPARELVVAERGPELVVELETFPLVAAAARASGRLAGNPWLAGGAVALGRGRPAVVGWEGRRWRLRTGFTAPAAPAATEAANAGAALARLRLGEERRWLPAGEYRLERIGGVLELRAGEFEEPALPPLGQREPRPAAWSVERVGGRGVRALVVWEEEGAMPPFPAATTLRRGAVEGLRLPGEELLRVAGSEPRRRRVAGFELRALAATELAAAGPLAVELARRLADHPAVTSYAGLRPERLAAASRRLEKRLRGLPLGRLLDLEPGRLAAALGPLAGCSASVLEIRREARSLRWRLCVEEPPEVSSR
jgi:hypothetical protein